MIYLLGKENCGRCSAVKHILINKNIEFEYYDIGKVYEDKEFMKMRNKVKKQATQEQGADYLLPLISRDDILITLEELIEKFK